MTYHYVITYQFQAPDGPLAVSWQHGTIIPEPGETRAQVFGRIFATAIDGLPSGSYPVPLLFTLEPNDLT